MKQSNTFIYETFSSLNELEENDRMLVEKAMESSKRAYAPYSGFHVGACLRLEDGSMVCGNNQENASYPQGLCAERVALFSASANHPDQTITALALTSKDSASLLSPCGACRQVLLEYEQKQGQPIRVLMASASGKVLVVQSAQNLLPFCFSKENLNTEQ